LSVNAMRQPLFVFVLLLSCCWFSSMGLAATVESMVTNDLSIEAELVAYDKAIHLVEAVGSVEADYQDYSISTEHLFYQTRDKVVSTEANFILRRGLLSIEGRNLRFDVAQGDGQADAVLVEYNGVSIAGRRVDFSKNKVRLQDATFTSCDLEPPHYHVTANEIIFYPDVKWVVSNWGFFWFGSWPIIPVPTYVYDLSAEKRERRNAPPVPDFGSNADDGTYVSERISWHATESWNDRVTFSYFQNKGIGVGIDGNYYLNENQDGNVRLFWNRVNQFYGGVTHHTALGMELSAADQDLYGVFFIPEGRAFDLTAELSYNERINYQRVSYYPRLTLTSKRIPWLSKNLKWDIKVEGGGVAELASGCDFGFASGALGTYYDIPLPNQAFLTPAIKFDHRWYGDGERWIQATTNLAYRQSVNDNFGFVLAHNHYLYNIGVSPLNFENYNLIPQDTFDTKWLFKAGINQIGINTSHYLPSWNPHDIDYIFALGFHCYDIIFTYRVMRSELTFGFNLVSR